jgi:leucyl/phenylalanyl-tRNA--protein transferase
LKTLHILSERIWFPPLEEADEEGLLAAGGDLCPERLLVAYRKGIFPWFEGDVPLWWSPDPRFVLFPESLRISKSMKQVLVRNQFTLTCNRDFESVINHCRLTPRPGQSGTWITTEVLNAYLTLHQMGIACSFEAWQGNTLAGGLYGIRLGKVFFGESMFSNVSNASKAAFIAGVKQLQQQGCRLIDCQVYTEHLESLGASFIPRKTFTDRLNEWIDEA